MNIMLVSVTNAKGDRIRKAIGATKQAIVFQFLFEAMSDAIGGIAALSSRRH